MGNIGLCRAVLKLLPLFRLQNIEKEASNKLLYGNNIRLNRLSVSQGDVQGKN